MMRASLLLGIGVLGAIASAPADTALIAPLADAFVDAAQASKNYGGAGSLGIAPTNAPKGEFQSLLRFDTAGAITQFDGVYGPGQWVLSAVSLRLSATSPNNSLFNAQGAGQFEVSWMADDTWVEGTGTPSQPQTTGVTFGTLPAFLGPADESLGVFSFGGETGGTSTYPLAMTSAFAGELGGGGTVSLRLSAVGTNIGYLFNSRSFGTPTNQPALVVEAALRCPADFDRSGAVGVQDIFDFLNAWFAGDSRTDFDGMGGITVQDIFSFLNTWFLGC